MGIGHILRAWDEEKQKNGKARTPIERQAEICRRKILMLLPVSVSFETEAVQVARRLLLLGTSALPKEDADPFFWQKVIPTLREHRSCEKEFESLALLVAAEIAKTIATIKR